jgi:hypothetical protein
MTQKSSGRKRRAERRFGVDSETAAPAGQQNAGIQIRRTGQIVYVIAVKWSLF